MTSNAVNISSQDNSCAITVFANEIRNARKQKGWSQGHLAKLSNVSRPTVARIEGRQTVSTSSIAKIAQALDLFVFLSSTPPQVPCEAGTGRTHG